MKSKKSGLVKDIIIVKSVNLDGSQSIICQLLL